MKKPVILFDLDRTVFDTSKMSKTFDQLMLKILGNPEIEEFKKVKSDYKATLKRDREFVPEDYVKALSEKFDPLKYQELLDVIFSEKYVSIYKESVFPETIELFEKLKDNHTLGLYSEGTLHFQIHKFESTGLGKYLDKNLIFIVEAKDEPDVIGNLPKDCVIVDDKEIICKYLTENGTKSVWLNNKNGRKSDKFMTIYKLLELPDVLDDLDFTSPN